MRPCLAALSLTLATGCAHQALSGGELADMQRPAFISRIEEGAGPKALVFREDSAYGDKLKKLDPKEADRRLQAKLKASITRFEVAETLRANVFALLPRSSPWTETIDPTQTATALQSFLVEEVPANAPDYQLLEPLGADTVVEIVIEDYGMRSDDGRGGPYIIGYARAFRLGGGEMYRRSFISDAVAAGLPHLDPFKVGKEPERFRLALLELLEAISDQVAEDLQPSREAPAPAAPSPGEKGGGDPEKSAPPSRDELPAGELPEP